VKLFRRQLRVGLTCIQIREQQAEAVTTVHHEIELVHFRVPRHRHEIARAGDVAFPVAHLVLQLGIGFELPHAGAPLELWARIETRRVLRHAFGLTGVRRRADIHVHIARTIEGQGLRAVGALHRETAGDGLRRARGDQVVVQRNSINRNI